LKALVTHEDPDRLPCMAARLQISLSRADETSVTVQPVQYRNGEDSALYKALGYVPKSERKSGLRRTAALKKAA
jgi:hypothetical protein